MTRFLFAFSLTLSLVAVAADSPGYRLEHHLVLEGPWTHTDQFSAALMSGTHLIVGVDEGPALQVGRRTATAPDRYAWDHNIPLVSADVELDIEAVTSVGEVIYALGSHSATRRRADRADRTQAENIKRLGSAPEKNPDRASVFRFKLSSDGHASPVESTSLTGFLSADPILKGFVGVPSKENGIDLEGLAADGDTLYAGFRGPVLRHGLVPILRFTFAAPAQGSLLFMNLGGRGVRDLVRVSDGFLVLAGPVGDSDQPHRLYWWNGRNGVPGKEDDGGRTVSLGDVPAPAGGKSEAIVLLGETSSDYRIAVFYDGVSATTTVEGDRPSVFRVSRAPVGR
jgi:hypothetical protein